jgi:hypothetical protein
MLLKTTVQKIFYSHLLFCVAFLHGMEMPVVDTNLYSDLKSRALFAPDFDSNSFSAKSISAAKKILAIDPLASYDCAVVDERFAAASHIISAEFACGGDARGPFLPQIRENIRMASVFLKKYLRILMVMSTPDEQIAREALKELPDDCLVKNFFEENPCFDKIKYCKNALTGTSLNLMQVRYLTMGDDLFGYLKKTYHEEQYYVWLYAFFHPDLYASLQSAIESFYERKQLLVAKEECNEKVGWLFAPWWVPQEAKKWYAQKAQMVLPSAPPVDLMIAGLKSDTFESSTGIVPASAEEVLSKQPEMEEVASPRSLLEQKSLPPAEESAEPKTPPSTLENKLLSANRSIPWWKYLLAPRYIGGVTMLCATIVGCYYRQKMSTLALWLGSIQARMNTRLAAAFRR